MDKNQPPQPIEFNVLGKVIVLCIIAFMVMGLVKVGLIWFT